MPRKTVAAPRGRQRAASAKTATPDLPLFALARQVRSWADTLLSVTGSAADIGLSLTQARVKDPKRKQAVAKAGTQLRRWREAAGMTARELSEAVGLGDAKLLEEAEGGVATLPFEIVLRLAGVLGRNDPIPVAMSLTRQYNPELWKTLESLGVGKLAVQGARERELANVYRGNDAARKLDDKHYELKAMFPWPVKETRCKLSVRKGKRGETYVIQWRQIDGTLKKYEGVAWIQPFGKQRTLLTYQMLAVPKVFAPSGLMSEGLRNAVKGYIAAVRTHVAKLRHAPGTNVAAR